MAKLRLPVRWDFTPLVARTRHAVWLRWVIVVFAAAAVVVAFTYAVRGCRPETPPAPDDTAYVPPGAGGSPTTFSGGRTSEADFQDIPVVMTGRVCHNTFDGVVTARLSPDGRSYLVNTTYYRGNRKYYGFSLYNLEGKTLWDHIFPSTDYRSEAAGYVAGGKLITAQAADYEEDGEFHLIDAEGRPLMNRPTTGWTQATVSDDGSWVALFNEVNRRLEVFGPPNLSPAWSTFVSQGARALFIGDGPELLVCEGGRARLFDDSGRTVWTVTIPGGRRWNVALSPDRRRLAVSTGDPDSTTYLYSVSNGSLIWSQFLVAGGHKELTFSPDGATVAVFDVGQHGDIYMLRAATGEILWRFRIEGRPNSGITVEALQFSRSGKSMTADIVESAPTDDAYLYYHFLLSLTPDGRALWISPLGSEVDVDLAAASGLALVATNNPIDARGDVVNSVTLVSFTAEPQAGAAGSGGS